MSKEPCINKCHETDEKCCICTNQCRLSEAEQKSEVEHIIACEKKCECVVRKYQ